MSYNFLNVDILKVNKINGLSGRSGRFGILPNGENGYTTTIDDTQTGGGLALPLTDSYDFDIGIAQPYNTEDPPIVVTGAYNNRLLIKKSGHYNFNFSMNIAMQDGEVPVDSAEVLMQIIKFEDSMFAAPVITTAAGNMSHIFQLGLRLLPLSSSANAILEEGTEISLKIAVFPVLAPLNTPVSVTLTSQLSYTLLEQY